MATSNNIYDVRRSKLLLAELEKNGQLRPTHEYPVQVLRNFNHVLNVADLRRRRFRGQTASIPPFGGSSLVH